MEGLAHMHKQPYRKYSRFRHTSDFGQTGYIAGQVAAGVPQALARHLMTCGCPPVATATRVQLHCSTQPTHVLSTSFSSRPVSSTFHHRQGETQPSATLKYALDPSGRPWSLVRTTSYHP